MADSPAVQAPLDPKEEPILTRLLQLRDELSLLKQDKSTYVKSQDVIHIYDHIIEQVHLLNTLRNEHGKPLESNRVDRVLGDCFQLISLFFLTIGRNNEAPAVYSMASTVRRLLDHLKEAAFFTAKDLESIGQSLDKMYDNLKRGKDTCSPHLLTLLESRMDFPSAEVEGFRNQLKEIKATMVDGKFLAEDSTAPAGQDIVIGLLDRCFLWSDIVLTRQGKIDERFKTIYDKLSDIRNHLERLTLTQAWSLRETDLYNYQRQLDQVDESRINGNFEDPSGYKADLHAQRTLLYLLRRSYAYIYSLIIASEPVSEALLPIFNQLQTLRRCLIEVKRSGGVSSPRELYPYSMKLSSIDNMRVDGKFMVGADVPEGQGSVSTLLAECFDLQYELKVEAEEHETDDS